MFLEPVCRSFLVRRENNVAETTCKVLWSLVYYHRCRRDVLDICVIRELVQNAVDAPKKVLGTCSDKIVPYFMLLPGIRKVIQERADPLHEGYV